MTLRILIADDEKAARFGLAKALAQGGYEIAEAADCQSALRMSRVYLSVFQELIHLAMPVVTVGKLWKPFLQATRL